MGEPRYNGAFVPYDDEKAAALASSAQATGGFIASFFPKVRPGLRVDSSGAPDSGAEKLDFNDAGRYNGAFQMSLDVRTEHQIDSMDGMHPITKFIAKNIMQDPVSLEKRRKAHIAFQESAIARSRSVFAQPLASQDGQYWKTLRPVMAIHNDVPVRENTYKHALLHMETRNAQVPA